MGDKYEEVMARNRRRIFGLAAAGLLNYWIAALLFVLAVTIGGLGILFIRALFEGDFGLVMKGVRAIPKGIAWAVEAGWLSSAVMTFVFFGFIAFVTIFAIVQMWGRARKLEESVPRTGVTNQYVAGILEAVAIAAGVPVPAHVVMLDPALNSCSVGRKPENATIVVTSGLVNEFSRDELEAVLAYELSRINSFDTSVSTWTAAVTGRTIELSQESGRILVSIMLLIPARLAHRLRARSLRRQASQRDILALNFTRYPEALLSALEKIDADKTSVAGASVATAPLWLEWPWLDAQESQKVPALTGRIAELKTLVAAL